MPFQEDTKVTIEIGPLKLDVPLGTMPPEEIRLWDQNPRIKHLLAGLDGFPRQEDLQALIEESQPNKFKDLRKDIEKFGQQEAVYLKGDASSGPIDVATVIEGNTRVAILSQLHDRDSTNPRFQRVKAYLLPHDISEEKLAILMANFHVKGTMRNQWDRYQIGSFLHDQIEQRGLFNQTELAEHIGKSPSWVSRHLIVYKFALDYKDEIENADGMTSGEAEKEVNHYFSILEEAWKVKAFRDECDRDLDAKKTLFRWVHDGKFKDHRNIRAIYDIYMDPRKREQVENGELGAGDDAARRLGKSIPFHDELDRLCRRIEGVQIGDLESIDRQRVRKVKDALENLESMIDRLVPSQ
jgi:hypothetical protein